MLYTKELVNIEKLKDITINDENCCKIPLFHGTRRYALQVTDKERLRFYSSCKQVMEFARDLGTSDQISDDELQVYQKEKNPLFLDTTVYKFGSRKYEYGDVYLTTSFLDAISFSNKAGGELGEQAYRQCVGFKDFGIVLNETVANASKIVTEEYEKYRNSEKIILAYYGINYADLLLETGEPFLRVTEEGEIDKNLTSFRIKQLYQCKVLDNCKTTLNYRLGNPVTYTAFVIRQYDYKDGISCFTKIVDVDRYLKFKKIKLG